MDSIERLVVHIEHALTFSQSANEHEIRLALLLWDGAAELLLYRTTQYLVREAEMYARWDPTHPSAISATRRKKIEYDFSAKVDLLVERSGLDEATAAALKYLHRYRNEAYHRDHIRPETIQSAVRVYAQIVLRLMLQFQPMSLRMLRLEDCKTLAKYFVDGNDSAVRRVYPFGIQGAIAEKLLEGTVAESTLPAILANHCVARFEDFDETEQFVTGELRDRLNDEHWDREATITYAQIEWKREMFNWTSAEYRQARNVKIMGKDLVHLEAEIEALRTCPSDLDAFRLFSNIEEKLEQVEIPLRSLAGAIDEQIDREIDDMRGK